MIRPPTDISNAMSTDILNWADATPRLIESFARRGAVALWPLGAIEQHGEHLPLSTDLDIADGLVAAALPRVRAGLPVLRLPSLAVGLSTEHTDFAGTLSLDTVSALATLCATGECVARAGIRRLVLFNAHGGNKSVVDLAALQLRARQGMLAVRAHYFRFAPPPGVLPADELRHGLHGGALETSMMLHLAPHKVRRDALADFDSSGAQRARAGCLLGPEGEAAHGWMAQDLHRCGVAGDARLADADIGRTLVGHYAGMLARIVEEAADFDLDTLRRRD